MPAPLLFPKALQEYTERHDCHVPQTGQNSIFLTFATKMLNYTQLNTIF